MNTNVVRMIEAGYGPRLAHEPNCIFLRRDVAGPRRFIATKQSSSVSWSLERGAVRTEAKPFENFEFTQAASGVANWLRSIRINLKA